MLTTDNTSQQSTSVTDDPSKTAMDEQSIHVTYTTHCTAQLSKNNV